MAATTLSELITLVGDYEFATLLHNLFVVPDPVFAAMPMKIAEGGASYTQRYIDPAGEATHMSLYDTMTASALTEGSYSGFMHYAYDMDDDPILLSPQGNGQQGHDRKREKQMRIFTAISNAFRKNTIVGPEATYVIGANIQAIFGVAYAFEYTGVGSQFGFNDVHARGGVSTVNHAFKWTTLTNLLQYKAPGDTAYGPAVEISATNYFRVPLYSGGTSGAANYAKSCRITCTAATLMAAGDYDSATGGLAADYVVATPTKKPMGFLFKTHPKCVAFDNISFTSDGYATNPTAAGAAVDEDNLNWLTMKMLDAASGNAGKCVMLVDDMTYIAAGSVIRALGQKAETYRFMGREFRDLNFSGVRIQRCPWLPTGTSPNGSVTTRKILGLVLGEDACHLRYSLIDRDATMAALVARLSGSQRVEDQAGARQMPITYYETLAASNTLVTNQIGVFGYDPALAQLDKVFLLENVTA